MKFKRMIVVSVFAGVVGMLGFSGCRLPMLGGKLPTEAYPDDPGRLMSLSYSCNHMDYSACFSFSIFEEEDGVRFSAVCRSVENDEFFEADFEDAPAAREDMDALREIAERNQLYDFLKNYKSPKREYFALDETTYSISGSWEKTGDLSAGSAGVAGKEIEAFFRALAMRMQGGMPAAESCVSELFEQKE